MRRVENVLCFINRHNVFNVGLIRPTSKQSHKPPQMAQSCLISTISLFDEATPPHPPYQNDEKLMQFYKV